MPDVKRIFRHFTDNSNFDCIEYHGSADGSMRVTHIGRGTYAPSRHIAARRDGDILTVTVGGCVKLWSDPDPTISVRGAADCVVRVETKST